MKWHRQMCKNGNLYLLMKDEAIVGGAIMFEDEKDADIVYVGRIFVDALQYRKGYGKEIMQQIEKVDVENHILRLETLVSNQRTNFFIRSVDMRKCIGMRNPYIIRKCWDRT